MAFESIESLDWPVPVNSVSTKWLDRAGVSLDLLRLDQLHPDISGNKWYKLRHNLEAAREQGKSVVLSYGGAWSNHIHALAAAGQYLGIKTVGVIRGERPKDLSAMLQDAESWGMRLHFVSRQDYRQLREPDAHNSRRKLLDQLQLSEASVYPVPEGGGNTLGVKGCEEILAAGGIIASDYDEIWLACGTGSTLAGVANAAWRSGPDTRVVGVAVLKGAGFLNRDIQALVRQPLPNWTLLTDHHCGGYARTDEALLALMETFERDTGIPLDPVYTGKVLKALKQRVESGGTGTYGKRLLMIHTGGLQGRRGFDRF